MFCLCKATCNVSQCCSLSSPAAAIMQQGREATRGWGAGERRMERRQAAAELARETATAAEADESQYMHYEAMQAIRHEEDESKQRKIHMLRHILSETEEAERVHQSRLYVHNEELEYLRGQVGAVNECIAQVRSIIVFTECENQSLHAELQARNNYLESYLAEVHEERRQNVLLASELRDALRNIVQTSRAREGWVQARDAHSEHLVAEAVTAAHSSSR